MAWNDQEDKKSVRGADGFFSSFAYDPETYTEDRTIKIQYFIWNVPLYMAY